MSQRSRLRAHLDMSRRTFHAAGWPPHEKNVTASTESAKNRPRRQFCAPADLAVEAGVVGPDLAPDLLGEHGEREDVETELPRGARRPGELLRQRLDEPVEM